MSTLNVDKVDPSTGTALELGTSGDTVTVPSGVGLTLTDSTLLLPTTITSTTEVKTNKISPATGAAFALGDSGDTFTVPSGATIVNSGTATGFGGGKILQVQHVKIETATTVTATSLTTTGVSDIITPSATTSKILIMMDVILGNYEGSGTGNKAFTAMYRDIGGAGFSVIYRDEANYCASYGGSFASGNEISSSFPTQMIFVDSPSTTSACTYTFYMCPYGGTGGDSANTGPSNLDSSVVLMEIDGS